MKQGNRLWIGIAALAAVVPVVSMSAEQRPDIALANRWYRNLYAVSNQYWACSSAGMAAATNLAAQAAQHGYTGVVVPIHYFFMTQWTAAHTNNFRSFVSFCSSRHLEVIPDWFHFNSAGMVFDRNFAEADPIDNMPLMATNGALWPAPDPFNHVTNGSFEAHSGDTFPGYLFIDQPGVVSFADTNQFYDGSVSVRLENFSANNGMGRICQEFNLRTNFHYRVRFSVRKESCPTSIKVLVNGKLYTNTIQNFSVTSGTPDLPWTAYECEFTTGDYAAIRVYIGIWGGSTGRVWIDTFEVVEAPSLFNIVRREGTPLFVRSMDGLTAYQETNDFSVVSNVASLASIGLPPGSSITNGQTALLSCYRAADYNGYKALCMSHEPVYTLLRQQAQAIHDLFPFKKFFLYIDEIRCMASCKTCRDRGIPTSQILGDCVTRLCDIVHGVDPSVQIYTWADMLDPNWNAHDHYYKVVGDLTGSWNHVPKDMVIVPWGDCVPGSSTSPSFLSNSLAHFTTNGFSVMGCGYYDTGNLIGTTNWIQLLLNFTNACGLMYATWHQPPDFSMLPSFGDLMMSTIELDENSNGMPDWWEVRYFAGTNALDGGAQDDWDHDGMSNLAEYRAGTSPTNAVDVLKFAGIAADTTSATGMVLRWSSVANKWYAIQTSSNLLAGFDGWSKTNIPATPTMNTQTIVVDQVKSHYYRVTVEP